METANNLHYIIIIGVVVIIFFGQVGMLISTVLRIYNYRNIFPKNRKLIVVNSIIQNEGASSTTLETIVNSINQYLLSNSNSIADFHLMKDVVDRNCDAREDEINTQSPYPIYLGLIGTMLGIVIGVGMLILGGGLDAIFAGEAKKIGEAIEGVRVLLGGVAIAMITSVCGILFTTGSSFYFKKSQQFFAREKDQFLSWIQSQLLPSLSTDLVSSFGKLSGNLNSFNESFGSNAKQLNATLDKIKETCAGQAEILATIQRLNINRIATANVQVYDRLQKSTDEIGRMGDYVSQVNQYLTIINSYINSVHDLSVKLDQNGDRIKVLEQMGQFFQSWEADIVSRRSYMTRVVGEIDDSLHTAIHNLYENSQTMLSEYRNNTVRHQSELTQSIEQSFNQLQDSLAAIITKFEQAVDVQASRLEERLNLLPQLTEDLKELSAIKQSMATMAQAFSSQERGMTKLIDTLENLRGSVMSGTSMSPIKTSPWSKMIGLVSIVIMLLLGINVFTMYKVAKQHKRVTPTEVLQLNTDFSNGNGIGLNENNDTN